MSQELTNDEIRRILAWAVAADAEGALDGADLPLLEKLARAVGDDPAEHGDITRTMLEWDSPYRRGAAIMGRAERQRRDAARGPREETG